MSTRFDVHVGFAFAWADVLLEAGSDLAVRRAEGAAGALFGCGLEALVGRCLTALVAAPDRAAVAAMGELAPGTRLTLERVTLQPADGEPGRPVALSALCLEQPADVLCVGVRALPEEGSADGAAPRAASAQAEQLAAFARQAGREMAHDPQAGVTVVALSGLEALKPRLSHADAGRLGEILKAVVSEAVGAETPYVNLQEGAYAFLDARPGDDSPVADALEAATRALDPEGRGVATARGTAKPGLGLQESDLVSGLVCSLTRFCEGEGPHAPSDRPSLADLAANFSRLVSDGVAEVRTFADLVAQGDFEVALQPILDARRGTLHHYEALCRFPGGGSPARRLGFAERAGLIHQFDLAMLHKVADWIGRQPRNRTGPAVGVNVSGHSLTHPGFVDAVERLLEDRPWLAGRLLIELTETLPLRDRAHGDQLIQRLRHRRVPVCIDDFGAGAASFQYLAELSVDYVKFDGSTVEAAVRGARGQAFLSALTAFCRRLGIKTVAEMVETREHLAAVRGCGVDYLQGYLFGAPNPDPAAFRPIPNGHLIAGRARSSVAS